MSNHLIRSLDREIAKARDKASLNLAVHGRGSVQATKARAEVERLEAERYGLKCDLIGRHNIIEGVRA